MKYPNIAIGETIKKHNAGLELQEDGQWLGTDKEWRQAERQMSLTEIYRASNDYDDYMEQALDEGYDSEEADVIYYELTFKYSN
jgi:hypothetical protein